MMGGGKPGGNITIMGGQQTGDATATYIDQPMVLAMQQMFNNNAQHQQQQQQHQQQQQQHPNNQQQQQQQHPNNQQFQPANMKAIHYQPTFN